MSKSSAALKTHACPETHNKDDKTLTTLYQKKSLCPSSAISSVQQEKSYKVPEEIKSREKKITVAY